MNTTNKFQDLTLNDQLAINGGTDTGSKSFWRDVARIAGVTIHAIVLGLEAFGGGAAIVPGYVK